MPDSLALSLDPRRHAYRDDLADIGLEGRVTAKRFVAAREMRVRAGRVAMLKRPEAGLGYETELVHGEVIDVFEERDGWAWGQARCDRYVGYLRVEALAAPGPIATHRVIAHRSFLYPGPSMKATPRDFLPFMSAVAVTGKEGDWCETADGFIYAPHLTQIDELAVDPVAVAERFIGVPYLWGGKSSLGYDCSGLVQTCCFAAGLPSPRDSDMQEAELGDALPMPTDPATLPRGALLFWPGHVALSQGAGFMIHANAYHMAVVSEAITPALARIAAKGSALRSVRMLPQAR